MRYDLTSPLDAQNACARLDLLTRRGATIDITEKKPRRSISQNAYLHLIIAYFGTQTGYEAEWVKQQYYKRHCNPDTFIATRYDPLIGSNVAYLRSSATLTTEEMTLTIERFRTWAAQEGGIYLPSPDDMRALQLAETEIERHKAYL